MMEARDLGRRLLEEVHRESLDTVGRSSSKESIPVDAYLASLLTADQVCAKKNLVE